mgnify:FL=1
MKKLGYYVVNLSSKKYSVHRLIALTFLNNEDNKPFVNHKNNIPTDNYLSNLEWVTISENIRHGHKMNRLKKELEKFYIESHLVSHIKSLIKI